MSLIKWIKQKWLGIEFLKLELFLIWDKYNKTSNNGRYKYPWKPINTTLAKKQMSELKPLNIPEDWPRNEKVHVQKISETE